jgi:hypothetical protein
MSIAKKYLLLTAFVSAAIILGLAGLLMVSYQQNQALKTQVIELEAKLAQQEQARSKAIKMAGPGAASSPVDRKIKDLSTRFVGDSRNLAEKLRDFTAEHTSAQDIAIACKVVVDLAENPDALSDEQLVWLYGTQTDRNLQRVIAQVLSLRGDNQLLDTYIATLKAGLADTNPAERRKVLGELAKTRYAASADVIVPLLADTDTSVVLDALLALRVTGNERHLPALEKPLQSGDESVRWLASDARNNLELLSKKARMSVNSVDIVAELPVITLQ